MAGPLDSVVFRDQARRADEEVDERELVGHRGEPVKLHEGPRERPRVLPLPLQEHPVAGHEDVVEDGERFGHPVPARERVVERGGGVVAVGADHQGQAARRDRHRERHGVRPVALPHRPRGEHDELVGVHAHGRVHLRAADHDPVIALLDDPQVVIRVRLVGRAGAPVALDVGLRHRHREIPVAAVGVERPNPIEIARAPRPVHLVRHQVQGEQRVGPDLLEQRDDRPSQAGARLNELHSREQALGGLGEGEVAAHLPAGGMRDDRERPEPGIRCHRVVQCRVVDGDPKGRVRGHIRDALPVIVHDPAVP